MFSEQMLGYKLITKQTGAAGKICNAVKEPVLFEYTFRVL